MRISIHRTMLSVIPFVGVLASCITTPASRTTFKVSQCTAFREHPVFRDLVIAVASSSDYSVENLSRLWWEDFLRQEPLMANISNAAAGDPELRSFLKEKLKSRAKSLLRFTAEAEDARAKLIAEVAPSFEALQMHVPIEEPIDIYEVLHIHPFNAKEFIATDRPAFAINLAFPDWAKQDRKELRRIIVHEGFHVLHLRKAGRDLLTSTTGLAYREGLAVLATERVYPDGSAADNASLSDDDIKRINNSLPEIARSMLAELDGSYEQFNKHFFSTSTSGLHWPPRSGYYVSAMAIKAVSTGRSLKELMDLSPASYSELMRSGLHCISRKSRSCD